LSEPRVAIAPPGCCRVTAHYTYTAGPEKPKP